MLERPLVIPEERSMGALCLWNRHSQSKLLLLLEEHRKADNGSVNQQTAKNRHYHSRNLNRSAVC